MKTGSNDNYQKAGLAVRTQLRPGRAYNSLDHFARSFFGANPDCAYDVFQSEQNPAFDRCTSRLFAFVGDCYDKCGRDGRCIFVCNKAWGAVASQDWNWQAQVCDARK